MSTVPTLRGLLVWADEVPHAAAWNMAADAALLGQVDAPVLRVYRWAAPAVSVGFFTPLAPVIKVFPDREVVRRPTGGGVVLHGEDLTYSLVLPEWHPLRSARAGECYLAVHRALAAWLGGEVAACAGGGSASSACFAAPVTGDVLLGGRKIAGAAQRRTRFGLLHQGSIVAPGIRPGMYEELADALSEEWTRWSPGESFLVCV